MATNYKVLGQSAPSAITNTTIYTCPALTETIISSIVVCNRSDSTSFFRIAVRPDGEALESKHYICYDSPLAPNNSSFITIGLTLNASDVISVYSSSANLSFSIYGSEIS